jgi:hypothetical protein
MWWWRQGDNTVLKSCTQISPELCKMKEEANPVWWGINDSASTSLQQGEPQIPDKVLNCPDLSVNEIADSFPSPVSYTTFVWSLWKYCQTRNQATLRDVEELRFLLYFILCQHPRWGSTQNSEPSSEITGFLKSHAEDQVANRWVHTGVRDPQLFR